MKKTLSTITLAATLMFGATLANAEGIIVSDREGIIVSDKVATPCSAEKKEGIIVSDFFSWIRGIIVSDKKADNDCTSKEGIIVSDRTEGIIVSD